LLIILPSCRPPKFRTKKPLAALGVTDPAQLAALFAEMRARFDSEAAEVHDEAAFNNFAMVAGRQIPACFLDYDNWLKPRDAGAKARGRCWP